MAKTRGDPLSIVRRASVARTRALEEHRSAILAAAAAGHSHGAIAAAAGLSRGRISQIVGAASGDASGRPESRAGPPEGSADG